MCTLALVHLGGEKGVSCWLRLPEEAALLLVSNFHSSTTDWARTTYTRATNSSVNRVRG